MSRRINEGGPEEEMGGPGGEMGGPGEKMNIKCCDFKVGLHLPINEDLLEAG